MAHGFSERESGVGLREAAQQLWGIPSFTPTIFGGRQELQVVGSYDARWPDRLMPSFSIR